MFCCRICDSETNLKFTENELRKEIKKQKRIAASTAGQQVIRSPEHIGNICLECDYRLQNYQSLPISDNEIIDVDDEDPKVEENYLNKAINADEAQVNGATDPNNLNQAPTATANTIINESIKLEIVDLSFDSDNEKENNNDNSNSLDQKNQSKRKRNTTFDEANFRIVGCFVLSSDSEDIEPCGKLNDKKENPIENNKEDLMKTNTPPSTPPPPQQNDSLVKTLVVTPPLDSDVKVENSSAILTPSSSSSSSNLSSSLNEKLKKSPDTKEQALFIPLNCPDCNLRFLDEETLKLHSQIHSADNVSCPCCNLVFTSSLRLVCHMRRKHLHIKNKILNEKPCLSSDDPMTIRLRYDQRETFYECQLCGRIDDLHKNHKEHIITNHPFEMKSLKRKSKRKKKRKSSSSDSLSSFSSPSSLLSLSSSDDEDSTFSSYARQPMKKLKKENGNDNVDLVVVAPSSKEFEILDKNSILNSKNLNNKSKQQTEYGNASEELKQFQAKIHKKNNNNNDQKNKEKPNQTQALDSTNSITDFNLLEVKSSKKQNSSATTASSSSSSLEFGDQNSSQLNEIPSSDLLKTNACASLSLLNESNTAADHYHQHHQQKSSRGRRKSKDNSLICPICKLNCGLEKLKLCQHLLAQHALNDFKSHLREVHAEKCKARITNMKKVKKSAVLYKYGKCHTIYFQCKFCNNLTDNCLQHLSHVEMHNNQKNKPNQIKIKSENEALLEAAEGADAATAPLAIVKVEVKQEEEEEDEEETKDFKENSLIMNSKNNLSANYLIKPPKKYIKKEIDNETNDRTNNNNNNNHESDLNRSKEINTNINHNNITINNNNNNSILNNNNIISNNKNIQGSHTNNSDMNKEKASKNTTNSNESIENKVTKPTNNSNKKANTSVSAKTTKSKATSTPKSSSLNTSNSSKQIKKSLNSSEVLNTSNNSANSSFKIKLNPRLTKSNKSKSLVPTASTSLHAPKETQNNLNKKTKKSVNIETINPTTTVEPQMKRVGRKRKNEQTLLLEDSLVIRSPPLKKQKKSLTKAKHADNQDSKQNKREQLIQKGGKISKKAVKAALIRVKAKPILKTMPCEKCSCKYCFYIAESFFTLNRHIIENHLDEEYMKCGKCLKFFAKPEVLEQHKCQIKAANCRKAKENRKPFPNVPQSTTTTTTSIIKEEFKAEIAADITQIHPIESLIPKTETLESLENSHLPSSDIDQKPCNYYKLRVSCQLNTESHNNLICLKCGQLFMDSKDLHLHDSVEHLETDPFLYKFSSSSSA